jgi:hypothetical protein
MRFVIIALLIVRLAHADMTLLKKGDPAPFDGIISDAAQMKEFRQINEDKKNLELQNLKLKDLSAIQDERVDIYKSELKSSESRSFWKSIGYFGLGVLVTSLAAKAAIESTR